MNIMTDKNLELLENMPEARNDVFRERRKTLLNAFDILKGNVNFGVENLTSEEREEIIVWYNAIKDLEEWAYDNVPEKIYAHVPKNLKLLFGKSTKDV